MPKLLSEAAISQYIEDGYFFPVKLLDAERVASCRKSMENFEASQGRPIAGAQRNKCHLLFKWVDDLMRDSTILDAAEDLLGPDILCWNTLFWVKEAKSQNFVSWHQDLRYWGLDTNDLVTVWLALSPATLESGCMSVLPGSHKGDLMPHKDEYKPDNLLTRGQEISVEVDEAKTVAMPLKPGQASMHNGRLAHASGPNNSTDRRIGVSFHYMPTCTKQVVGAWDSAALVRGEDKFGNFALTPRPAEDLDPAAVEFHERAANAVREVLFKDAKKVRPTL
ncbi:MAG: phytanoyl-CoA dioxygenase family protein [Planctomycetota bacterium]|nr:phytanoyl-CoA dioxygenase family protein [Planctomycetota bacterium]